MEMRQIGTWVGLYVLAFSVITGADIATTLWAASDGGAQEFNAAVATDSGGLHIRNLLLINAGVLTFTAGMMGWALHARDRIRPGYLAHPARAALKYLYLNPFADRNVPVSAFHYLALAPTVLLMKGFAVFNNSLIAAGVPDIITPLARGIHQLGGGLTVTYWLVIIILFHLFWLVGLTITARALRAAPGADLAEAATP